MFIPLILPLYYLLFWKKKDKVLFYLGIVLLFLISSFRATTVGVDVVHYMDSYRQARNATIDSFWSSFFSHSQEPIYHAIEFFFSRQGFSYRTFMLVQSFLFLLPITMGLNKIKENSTRPLLFLILLGFFFCSLNVTRQSIAFAFCLLGYCYLQEKKFIPALLSVFIALGFHVTSLLAVVVFALPFIRFNKVWGLAILLISYIVPIAVDLSTYILAIAGSMTSFEEYVSVYLSGDFESLNRLPIYNTMLTGIMVYALFKYKPKDDSIDLFFNIALVAVVVHNLLFGVPSWVTRITFYYDIAFIVFFSRWARKDNFAMIITLFYSALFYVHQFMILGHDGVIPFNLGF